MKCINYEGPHHTVFSTWTLLSIPYEISHFDVTVAAWFSRVTTGKNHILIVETDINIHREQKLYVKNRRHKFVPKPLPRSVVHLSRRSELHYAKSFSFPSHVRVHIFTKVKTGRIYKERGNAYDISTEKWHGWIPLWISNRGDDNTITVNCVKSNFQWGHFAMLIWSLFITAWRVLTLRMDEVSSGQGG